MLPSDRGLAMAARPLVAVGEEIFAFDVDAVGCEGSPCVTSLAAVVCPKSSDSHAWCHWFCQTEVGRHGVDTTVWGN